MTTELNVGELMDYCVDNSIDIREGYATYLFAFDNGYGASVVKRPGGYGFGRDLWELAVVRIARNSGGITYKLCYSTPITNDVIGYLTDEGVTKTLRKIKELRND